MIIRQKSWEQRLFLDQLQLIKGVDWQQPPLLETSWNQKHTSLTDRQNPNDCLYTLLCTKYTVTFFQKQEPISWLYVYVRKMSTVFIAYWLIDYSFTDKISVGVVRTKMIYYLGNKPKNSNFFNHKHSSLWSITCAKVRLKSFPTPTNDPLWVNRDALKLIYWLKYSRK